MSIILIFFTLHFTVAQILNRSFFVTALSFDFIGIVIERQKLINKEIENNDG